MPCDQIRQTSVDLSALGKIDLGLLAAAFRDLGLGGEVQMGKVISLDRGSYDAVTGKLQVYGIAPSMDTIKRAYSAQVVKVTAKRFGWQIKQVGQFEYQAIKR